MDFKDLTFVILAFILIFTDMQFAAAQEKKLIVFPKPFFSSNIEANIQLVKNQITIEETEEDTSGRNISNTENDGTEEKPFECTPKDAGTTTEKQPTTATTEQPDTTTEEQPTTTTDEKPTTTTEKQSTTTTEGQPATTTEEQPTTTTEKQSAITTEEQPITATEEQPTTTTEEQPTTTTEEQPATTTEEQPTTTTEEQPITATAEQPITTTARKTTNQAAGSESTSNSLITATTCNYSPSVTLAVEDCKLHWSKCKSSCYLMVQTEKNWQDAKDECDSHEAHLVFIESDDENSFIIELISHELSSSKGNPGVWLGLKNEIGGGWKWYDTPAQIPESGPRIVAGNMNNLCIRIKQSNHHWEDKDCSEMNFFICELEQ